MPKKAKSIINFAMKSVFFVLGILLACIVTLAVLAIRDYNNPNSLLHTHPTDDKLISNYIHHKSEFDQLANMLISENYVEVIYPDSNQCQIANQRLINSADNPSCAHFVKMFQDLGLDWAFTKLHTGNANLWLTVSSSGLSVSGSSKGYYYSSDGLQSYGVIVQDTDTSKGQLIFRQIEGNWYIFISR